ncbi:unnamed protein product (macronuclear) [Paramecium tetraurelia]|uniref:EF-hand domain-containing protein n=1 Tax=Paramecium tetraurelia TaxID=5888 RepID=A0D4H2_PARTE|nr:uncharacterized protein GSPATT00013405001 [Paramecium tetraurelia]CAK77939.1 unnamed protein product [Paramecium tetraurelia]|eukprot:XP_001445336.1 hypothetical protein (macronuclear) [Paramecium tetraurelia strain d4-2]
MDDEKKKKKGNKIDLNLLPSSMKERYAAMGILPKAQIPKSNLQVDVQRMKQKKVEKEQPIEQKLEGIEIKASEKKQLEKVFQMLKKKDVDYFDAKDVDKMLRFLGVSLTKSEIDLMLWEVDENLDGRVSWTEFLNMYKKCTIDKTGLEPKSLFHMIQFLMYLPPDRKDPKVTVEDTLELLYVRFGRQCLDSEIHAIFGDEEKNKDGEEKAISFSEYMEKINERAIQQRKLRKEEQKQQFQYFKKEKQME